MKVSYPKYKLGEEVVREIREPPTYGTCTLIDFLVYLLCLYTMLPY